MLQHYNMWSIIFICILNTPNVFIQNKTDINVVNTYCSLKIEINLHEMHISYTEANSRTRVF